MVLCVLSKDLILVLSVVLWVFDNGCGLVGNGYFICFIWKVIDIDLYFCCDKGVDYI